MDDWEPDFLAKDEETETEVKPTPAPRPAACALIVEDDPELAGRCSRQLDRLGIHAEVVWTREQAMDVLSRKSTPLAFAFVDRLRDGSGAEVALEAHRMRPATPLVVAGGSMADVLVSDDVVLCSPFTAEQFQAAFDAALFEDETRLLLLDAAEAVRAADLAEAAAPALAAPESTPEAEADLQLVG